jgi:hypothetical protein
MAKKFKIGPYDKAVFIVYRTEGQKVSSFCVKTAAEVTLADLFSDDVTTLKLARGWRTLVEYGRAEDAFASPKRVYMDFAPGDDPTFDPTPVPNQICLCGDETKSCDVSADPDCNNPSICQGLGAMVNAKEAKAKSKGKGKSKSKSKK